MIPILPSYKSRVATICDAVGEACDVPAELIRKHSNERTICTSRHIAMYVAHQLTGMSFPQIGRVFGGFHHTTVMHAIQKIGTSVQMQPEFASFMSELMDRIKANEVIAKKVPTLRLTRLDAIEERLAELESRREYLQATGRQETCTRFDEAGGAA